MKTPEMSTPTEHELLVGELTAALAASADAAGSTGLPPALAARIARDGAAMVRPTAPVARHAPRRGRSWPVWSGWLAAAAVLALWVGSQARRARDTSLPAPIAAAPPTPERAAGALRDSLLQNDRALLKLAWAPTADDAALAASGDVVWSARAQRGVMRLVGLAPNDRQRTQYQLWIFDKTRDARYPVDGGVFDVPAGATEVLIPISARVPVGDAVMFAVTVEVPGGVVVSRRERVVVVAKS